MDHILGAKQFVRRELDKLFAAADEMATVAKIGRSDLLADKVMAALFFEPSTRTRFSFESAMARLGGQVISTENAREFSSAIKGETLEDTIRVVSGYADVIVLRHHEQGAARRAAAVSDIPIINAGDGAGEHPTQALLDLYTIERELGAIDGLRIAMIGDLTYGRTVHSLAYLLTNYRDITIYFTSPPSTPIPIAVKEFLTEKGVRFEEESNLQTVVRHVDVLYQTRVQKERFASVDEYENAKGRYIIDQDIVSFMKEKSLILHPLPRAGEIVPEVDKDPRAAYFRQAHNGVFIRMALLARCVNRLNG